VVRCSERSLCQVWRFSSRKNESQVARTFGPGGDKVAQPSRDLNFANTGNGECFLRSLCILEDPASWHRDHHHASGIWFPLQIRASQPQGPEDQQFFQEDSLRAKAQHPRTKAANG